MEHQAKWLREQNFFFFFVFEKKNFFCSQVKGRNSGVLQITFISASNLSSADRNGLSDPYCMIPRNFFVDTKGREVRTKVIRKTLSPEWNEVFEFWTPDVRLFDFQVMSKNTNRQNCFFFFFFFKKKKSSLDHSLGLGSW